MCSYVRGCMLCGRDRLDVEAEAESSCLLFTRHENDLQISESASFVVALCFGTYNYYAENFFVSTCMVLLMFLNNVLKFYQYLSLIQ